MHLIMIYILSYFDDLKSFKDTTTLTNRLRYCASTLVCNLLQSLDAAFDNFLKLSLKLLAHE